MPGGRSSSDCSRSAARPFTRLGRLLLVDPDRLGQWSLTAFLKSWFDVRSAASADGALQMLHDGCFDAVVISDVLGESARFVEAEARRRNPRVRIVRTVTGVSPIIDAAHDTRSIEKPFDLRSLAELLGVPGGECM